MNLKTLTAMAYMYRNECTAQEEKFSDHKRLGCGWTWADCEAAYDLIREQFGSCAYELFDAHRAGWLTDEMPIPATGLDLLSVIYA